MISPRVAFAAGFAAAAGAALMLTGRIDGSVVAVLALSLAVRSAALAATQDVPHALRALGRQIELVPAWVGIAIVGAVRAGSGQLADVRGANAIAGLAVARGSVLLVVAVWIALIAGALALVAPTFGATTFGLAVARGPTARLELLGVVIQAALLATLFAGPQVRGIRDVGPWVVGAIAAAEVLWFGRRLARSELCAKAATAAAVGAVVLALLAGRP